MMDCRPLGHNWSRTNPIGDVKPLSANAMARPNRLVLHHNRAYPTVKPGRERMGRHLAGPWGDPGCHMSQTTTDTIRAAVLKHYSGSDAALLLAELGNTLRGSGAWPPANEERTLGQVIDGMAPEVKLVRDPDTPAYIAVVPAGKEHLIREAIERRRKARFLAELPRSVLLAFCLKVPEGISVYLQTSPPFQYHIGEPSVADGFEMVEASYRLPGLYVGDPRALSASDADTLSARIEAWVMQHKISIAKHRGRDKAAEASKAVDVPRPKKGENALERLYAAQPEGLGERIVMPFDIAVYLSRLP